MPIDTALARIENNDLSGAIESLREGGDAAAVVRSFNELMMSLYWDKKDIANTKAVAQAGIEWGMNTAAESDNPKAAFEIRAAVKALSYNLGSFLWPGWGEPGIEIAEVDLPVALEAAQLNLKLAYDLNRGDLPCSRAHWLLGAVHLALRQFDSARSEFALASERAIDAKTEAERLLADAFHCLTDWLEHPQSSDATVRLADARSKLAEVKDGDSFVQQIDTAAEVFGAA